MTVNRLKVTVRVRVQHVGDRFCAACRFAPRGHAGGRHVQREALVVALLAFLNTANQMDLGSVGSQSVQPGGQILVYLFS